MTDHNGTSRPFAEYRYRLDAWRKQVREIVDPTRDHVLSVLRGGGYKGFDTAPDRTGYGTAQYVTEGTAYLVVVYVRSRTAQGTLPASEGQTVAGKWGALLKAAGIEHMVVPPARYGPFPCPWWSVHVRGGAAPPPPPMPSLESVPLVPTEGVPASFEDYVQRRARERAQNN